MNHNFHIWLINPNKIFSSHRKYCTLSHIMNECDWSFYQSSLQIERVKMREKVFRGRTYLIRTTETFEIFQSVMKRKEKVVEISPWKITVFLEFFEAFPAGRKVLHYETYQSINQSINITPIMRKIILRKKGACEWKQSPESFYDFVLFIR